MNKLQSDKAIQKIKQHLKELEKLKSINYKKGSEQKDELSEKIKALINVSFEDSKEKLKTYNDEGHYPEKPFPEMSFIKSDEDCQYQYLDSLNKMKKQLKGYEEELSLLIDSESKTKKLTEIEGAIKAKQLEAKRRRAVVETKKAGAEIELLTFLRDELKRKDINTKVILELKTQLNNIEEIISKKLVQKDSLEFSEDKMLREMFENVGEGDPEFEETIIDAKKVYMKIKALREQLSTLEKQATLSSKDHSNKTSILNEISNTQNQITKLLVELADTWSNFTSGRFV